MESTERGARAFGELSRGAEAGVDLAACALALGRIVDPELDPAPRLAQLDRWGAAVAERLPGRVDAGSVARTVAALLFDEEGFRGEQEGYYAPANSYLHLVLQRRRGIPITLSVLFLEVASRAGLAARGVGTPGHFLVKYRDGERERFLDPFHGGREVEAAALRRQVRLASRGQQGSPEVWLSGVTKRQILARVLGNLKGAYLRRGDYEGGMAATEYLLAMSPWALEEIRDRGLLRYHLRRYDEALADLQLYRQHSDEPREQQRLDALISRLRRGEAGPAGPGSGG